MFELIFAIVITLYAIQTFIFLYGSFKKFPKLSDDNLPTVTVIVAARNEEKAIGRCLEALDRLVYPEKKMEIIIVDGNSDDSTYQIVFDYIKDKPLFKVIKAEEEKPELKGKALALDSGIKIATGEIILSTDADCAVPPMWAKTVASYYHTEDVAMVMGFTTQLTENKQFYGMQALDFIYLLSVAAGSTNLNFPLSCIGNNMSYKKSVYDDLGGYEKIPFSVTEDLKLMLTVFDLKKYKILYPLDRESLVVSEPCETVDILTSQKKRWGVGGLKDGTPYGYISVLIAFLSNLGLILSFIFFSKLSMALVLSKFLIDLILFFPVLKKLKLLGTLKYIFSFELYFAFYVLVLPISVLLDKKVVWKGKVYDKS